MEQQHGQEVTALSLGEIEAHLKGGGELVYGGGTLRVLYAERADRYLLVNSSGNGADHIQSRLSTVLDLMEQYVGDLSLWRTAEPPHA